MCWEHSCCSMPLYSPNQPKSLMSIYVFLTVQRFHKTVSFWWKTVMYCESVVRHVNWRVNDTYRTGNFPFDQQNLNTQWTTSLLAVTQVCRLKESISSTYIIYIELKNLLLTAMHWTTIPGHRLRANLNSSLYCLLPCKMMCAYCGVWLSYRQYFCKTMSIEEDRKKYNTLKTLCQNNVVSRKYCSGSVSSLLCVWKLERVCSHHPHGHTPTQG